MVLVENSGGSGPQLTTQYTVLDEEVVRNAVISERELENKAKK